MEASTSLMDLSDTMYKFTTHEVIMDNVFRA